MEKVESAWYFEVWAGFRPYLIKIVVDFMASCLLWTALFLFKLLTKYLDIGTWAAQWIENIHSVGSIAAFALFGILFATDVYAIQAKGKL